MKITSLYIYIDGSDLNDVADKIESSIETWLNNTDFDAIIVNQKHERTPDLKNADLTDWDLGINLNYDQLSKLNEIANYLYSLAIKYNRNFALGYYDATSNITENISYFGSEDGKPKISEIYEILGYSC